MTAAPSQVRVMVLDAWDEVRLDAHPGTRVADLAAAALVRAGQPGDPADYVMKCHGAEVDADATLADAGIEPGAPLIVLRRRRSPLR